MHEVESVARPADAVISAWFRTRRYIGDKDRGRIGLKLVAKHENGGLVTPEELVERAKDAPPRPPREERPRGGRDRGRSRERA